MALTIAVMRARAELMRERLVLDAAVIDAGGRLRLARLNRSVLARRGGGVRRQLFLDGLRGFLGAVRGFLGRVLR